MGQGALVLQETMDLDAVIAIAREAGSAVMDVYSRDFEVWQKDDLSPLTEADAESHRIIVDFLEQEHPAIPVLSEEGVDLAPFDKRRGWDRYWLVDPLDGTTEFIKRNGQFTVNIALIEDGRPVAGVVYAPERDWLYWAAEGGGAFRSVGGQPAQPIRCDPFPESGTLRVVGSSSHLSPETRDFLSELQARYDSVKFVALGSSLKICLVADGSADLYPRMGPTMEWDTAAAHAVLSAAGGKLVEHPGGDELRYNKEDLANSWFVAEAAR